MIAGCSGLRNAEYQNIEEAKREISSLFGF
jgi:hypothetical protein